MTKKTIDQKGEFALVAHVFAEKTHYTVEGPRFYRAFNLLKNARRIFKGVCHD